jgi:hypothetical protein
MEEGERPRDSFTEFLWALDSLFKWIGETVALIWNWFREAVALIWNWFASGVEAARNGEFWGWVQGEWEALSSVGDQVWDWVVTHPVLILLMIAVFAVIVVFIEIIFRRRAVSITLEGGLLLVAFTIALLVSSGKKEPEYHYVLCDGIVRDGWRLVVTDYRDGYLMACTYESPDGVDRYTARCTETGCDLFL